MFGRKHEPTENLTQRPQTSSWPLLQLIRDPNTDLRGSIERAS
jgi:hypothetical protein